MIQTVSHLQQRLAEKIAPFITSSHVLNAFLKVPRHLFVPAIYEPGPMMKEDWTLLTAQNNPERWLQKVYENEPLTTRLRANRSCSSSSQPNLMAQMLEALDLQPDHQVLEIGTGTGYNAALLAAIVGPASVTTIDVNEALLPAAKTAITACVGPGVHCLSGDGRYGHYGSYDRIIVTASSPIIMQPWLDQLKVHGKLIVNLQRSLMDIMLLVSKEEEEITGSILSFNGTFMELHDGLGVQQKRDLPVVPLDPILRQTNPFPLQNFQNSHFAFFLQCNLPHARYHRISASGEQFVYLKDNERLLQFYSNQLRGSEELWRSLRSIAQQFETYGCPKRHVFSFHIRDGKQILCYKDLRFEL